MYARAATIRAASSVGSAFRMIKGNSSKQLPALHCRTSAASGTHCSAAAFLPSLHALQYSRYLQVNSDRKLHLCHCGWDTCDTAGMARSLPEDDGAQCQVDEGVHGRHHEAGAAEQRMVGNHGEPAGANHFEAR